MAAGERAAEAVEAYVDPKAAAGWRTAEGDEERESKEEGDGFREGPMLDRISRVIGHHCDLPERSADPRAVTRRFQTPPPDLGDSTELARYSSRNAAELRVSPPSCFH